MGGTYGVELGERAGLLRRKGLEEPADRPQVLEIFRFGCADDCLGGWVDE